MDTMQLLMVILGLGLTLLAAIGFAIRQTLVLIEQSQRLHLEMLATITYMTADLAGFLEEGAPEDDETEEPDGEGESEKPEPVKVLPFRNGSDKGGDDDNVA
jgi:hypothetical protein